MGKKNPYITTIGFKRDDPDHVYVAELLNSMSRGKAQYIVKAVMLYQDMQESGEAVSASGAYDYERIRKVVLQVMKEYALSADFVLESPNQTKECKEDGFIGLNDADIRNIFDSLVAFRNY